mmetsp:Transcript_6249/g.28186  ORF Transcript_6249/g.28186 Transcript_6249/m.28186 type:complete len:382 (-) Transcript_6249:40-1185(-)
MNLHGIINTHLRRYLPSPAASRAERRSREPSRGLRRRQHRRARPREVGTLAYRPPELRLHRLKPFLLRVAELTQTDDLLDARTAQLDLTGEKREPRHERGLHERMLDDVPLPGHPAEHRVRKLGGRGGHGQRRGSRARLGLDNLGSAVLNPIRQRRALACTEPAFGERFALRQEREDGYTRVAADDRDVDRGRVQRLCVRHERPRSHHVEVRDPHELLRVVHPRGSEHLRGDRDRGVDGVGYHVEDGVRAVFGAVGDEVADDARVDLEEVVAGHAGLAGDARGDDDDVGILESRAELGVAGVTLGLGGGVDVGDVGGDAGGARDIVEGELGHEGVHLHEEAAGLADATGGAENRDLVAAGLVSKSLGDGARGGAEEGSHRC